MLQVQRLITLFWLALASRRAIPHLPLCWNNILGLIDKRIFWNIQMEQIATFHQTQS